MSKRIIVVDECAHCPYALISLGADPMFKCRNAGQEIQDVGSIPDWCPLIEATGYITPDLCIERIISYEEGEMLYEREKAKLRELIDQLEED